MIAGLERYYQIATCFRDEDLRADRQFEFRQLDVEMAFAEREDVLVVLEEAVRAAFEALEREPPASPFPRMTWNEVMLVLARTSPICASDSRSRMRRSSHADPSSGSLRTPRRSASSLRRKAFSRAELSRLEELVKEWGAKGLAYLVVDESARFVRRSRSSSQNESSRPFGPMQARPCSSRRTSLVPRHVLGLLRLHLGHELGLVDPSRDEFLWVVDFPLFELDEETGRGRRHHPFTGIAEGHEELIESSPGYGVGQPYDLVWNGWELGSGLDPDSPPGRTGNACSAPSASTRTMRGRSSASCSTRSRWGRRHTAASLSVSTASSRC